MGLRPESIGVGDERIGGRMKLAEALGSETLVHLDVPGVRRPEGHAGTDVVGRVGAGYAAEIGEHVELAADTAAAHWFDAGDGEAIR